MLSRDSFIDWSEMDLCRTRARMPLKTWFEHAHPDAIAREKKLQCDSFGYTLSLLHLSPNDKAWAPREWADASRVGDR